MSHPITGGQISVFPSASSHEGKQLEMIKSRNKWMSFVSAPIATAPERAFYAHLYYTHSPGANLLVCLQAIFPIK